jgi:hypothetical protein
MGWLHNERPRPSEPSRTQAAGETVCPTKTVLALVPPGTAPLRSQLRKLLQTCDTRYRAATAKEAGMALRATESDEDAPHIGRFFKNGFFVSSIDSVVWATSSTERLRTPTHKVIYHNG